MTRLTHREIRHNSRAIARQLNGLSVTDARRVLAEAGEMLEAETPVLVGDVEMDAGPNPIPNLLKGLGQGTVSEGRVKAVETSQGGVALLAGNDNDTGIAIVEEQGLAPELGVSAVCAFDHNNLQGQASAGTSCGQAMNGGGHE